MRAGSSRLARGFLGLALLIAALVRVPAVTAGYPYFGYVDEGHVLHPVTKVLQGQPWDPSRNNYPALSVVAIAGAARLVAFASDPWRSEPLLSGVGVRSFSYDQVSPPELILVGRVLCLLVSLGIVLLVGLLGRLIAGDVGGAVAAWAATLLPALVARGAIVSVDGFATFFVLAAALAVAGVRGPRQLGRLAVAGACCGLALVSKYPAGLVGLAVVATVAQAPWPWAQRLRGAAVAAVAGVVAAVAVMPALVTQPQAVWERILWQGKVYGTLEIGSYWGQAFKHGEWDLPLPYPELGVVFTLLAIAGAGLMLVSRTWRRLAAGWLLFAAVLVTIHANYSFQAFRNLLPLAALCCVTVGYLAGEVSGRLRRPRVALLGATALLAMLFFAPVRHYVADRLALVDSRREAVDWVAANRPTGRVLVQREAAFARSELARLGPRVEQVAGSEMANAARRGSPVLVLAHVVGADSELVMNAQVVRRLRRRYRVSASFGDQAASADVRNWRGNRMRVWILERAQAAPPRPLESHPEPAP